MNDKSSKEQQLQRWATITTISTACNDYKDYIDERLQRWTMTTDTREASEYKNEQRIQHIKRPPTRRQQRPSRQRLRPIQQQEPQGHLKRQQKKQSKRFNRLLHQSPSEFHVNDGGENSNGCNIDVRSFFIVKEVKNETNQSSKTFRGTTTVLSSKKWKKNWGLL